MGVGYVPEDRRVFTDITVIENLVVGQQPKREGAVTWTQEMLFDLFPNLAERRNNRGKALSGGEQQMLTIARTLMGNPYFVWHISSVLGRMSAARGKAALLVLGKSQKTPQK